MSPVHPATGEPGLAGTIRFDRDALDAWPEEAPVLLFETGLPTRCYVERTAVRFEHLRRSDAQSSCPYKGGTSTFWSAQIDGVVHGNVAWTYDFPTTAMAPIAGLVSFFNEDVDLFLDGQPVRCESAPATSRQTR